MKNIFPIIVVVALAIVLFFLLKLNNGNSQRDAELKKLKENFGTIVNWDSIASAREKQMFDSLRVVREEFQKKIDLQNNENRKLRARNSALEKRFNDLDLGVRPDF